MFFVPCHLILNAGIVNALVYYILFLFSYYTLAMIKDFALDPNDRPVDLEVKSGSKLRSGVN